MVRKTGGFCPGCGKVRGRMFGFGGMGAGGAEAGRGDEVGMKKLAGASKK